MTVKSEAAGPNGLTITSLPVDGVRVVTVQGEIDYHTGAVLRDALSPADDAAAPRTVIDLSGVTFMDSSGIDILIAAHQTAGVVGGRIRLACPTESVLRTLQIVGLDQIITCYPTLALALSD
ncbi:STAS domain-containing protein [Streptomyces sp. NPDC048362]|uniref:STAS domain-containing protein n=1 Tax=Streptomyces sp. NPDC048362 TaxID=3365539 RepID=UPI003723C737